MESRGYMGLFFCIPVANILLFCEYYKFKCKKLRWQDIWTLGCQYNGIHLCCSNRQLEITYDL